MKSLISYLTLKFVGPVFVDVIRGDMVYLYLDIFGDSWMKTSRWGLFRVKWHGPEIK